LTIAKKLIECQFLFELGIGKFGIYIGIVNLALLITANLTLKGIFFPMWGIIPVALGVVATGVLFGYYLVKHNVASQLQSHANQKANPELQGIIETLRRIEMKCDAIQMQLAARDSPDTFKVEVRNLK
jgi:hypothetical protein